jgi:hypothetical protein
MSYAELKNQPVRKLGPLGTIVAGITLVIVGVLFAFIFGNSGMQRGNASENWPTAEGVVTLSKVGDSGRPARKGDNRSYYPVVNYDYEVSEQTFSVHPTKAYLAV